MSDTIDQCESIQLKISDVKSLLILLQSPDTLVCSAALDGLTKYADAGSKQKSFLLSIGIIKTLIELTKTKDKKLKKSVICCLASVTESDEQHPDMKLKELLDALLLVLIKEDQPEILDEAAYCISNIAKDYGIKQEIRKSGGINVLVKLLENPDPDVKKNSALALYTCIEDFVNRTEIRYAKGLRPLLDLLQSEHSEVQELSLKCLIRCSEDHANVVELGKLPVIRKIIDFLAIDANSQQFYHALNCLSFQLEESESVQVFVDCNGMGPLMRLTSNDDVMVRKQSCICLAKALHFEKNQVTAREFGLIATIIQLLGSSDPGTASAACIAAGALAKNEQNQTELVKLGAIELLIKHIQSEEKEPRREGVAAWGNFCTSAKNRNRLRSIADGIASITKLLSCDDPQTVVNTCDCLTAFCEDSQSRQDVIKIGAVSQLITILEQPETKLQAGSCMALSRLLQEPDGQNALGKQAKTLIGKLVDFLQSQDYNLCRVSIYLLTIACQVESNAVQACSIGAVDQLILLSKQPAKKTTKFAQEGLEKLLNYHLTAKYWLCNHLNAQNVIQDGFYDPGYAGINKEKFGPLPSCTELQSRPVDMKREVLLVDLQSDGYLSQLLQFLVDIIPSMTPEQQIKAIALAVSKQMGGPIPESQLSQFNVKFKISELKMALNSNVIPIGQLNHGTFYHRALLFKTLCDRLGLKTCTLSRGEYNRAWNIVDIRTQTLSAKPIIRNARTVTSGRPKSQGVNTNVQPTPTPAATPSSSEQKQLYLGCQEVEAETYAHDEPAIVDLMFHPGRLIPVESIQAENYKRVDVE